jgi:diguanylate cyclase (GGDEF)-like protein/PAS domain S-box-containing protein
MHDRSEQLRVEGELETLLAELQATLESTADGILVTDNAGAIRGYNQRFAELWSLPEKLLTRQDDDAVYSWMEQCVIDKEEYVEQLAAIQRSPLAEASSVVGLRSGPVLERVTLPQYARGRPIGRVFSFRDITQRLADKSRLELAAKVFETSLDAIFITDAKQCIVAANPSFQRLTGYRQAEVIGHPPKDFLAKSEDASVCQKLLDGLSEQGFWEGELWNRRKDGEAYLCLISMVRVKDEAGCTTHFIGFFKDLTEALAARKRIEELAYHDALTGLPNRLMFSERFDFAKKVADRKQTSSAVLFIDLDRFKHINDALGHMFGDRVLIEVAERLQSCLRQVDTVSRLGGDEFLILLNDAGADGAEVTARRILQRLSAPFSLSEIAFTVTCSIGIALYPNDGDNMDELIKNADSAMYAVKERGRSGFRFYTRQMNIGLLSRVKLDHAIRLALKNDAFRLQYQPQVSLKSGDIIGTEALIRWRDAELGEVPPSRFIPIAEDSGAIIPLGDWVLRRAAQQAAVWYRQGVRVVTSVNVSALQFQQAEFVEKVADALQSNGLPPQLFELELTESILIQNIDETLKRLQALAQLGVQLAIDDFGTGYSSLAYLKRFPIQKLKIDQSFVRDIPADESDAAIVRAIINLGHSMNLCVIAEGVESESQQTFLQSAGCDEFQGFLYSPALESEIIEKLLLQRCRLEKTDTERSTQQ